MAITFKEIRKALNKLWPDLEQIWCFDKEYDFPTSDEVKEFLSDEWIDLSQITALNPDCDDFALLMHAKVKMIFNWSFGEAFANKVDRQSALHNLNICLCQDGVFLIDAKRRTIRKADKDKDNILWVRF